MAHCQRSDRQVQSKVTTAFGQEPKQRSISFIPYEPRLFTCSSCTSPGFGLSYHMIKLPDIWTLQACFRANTAGDFWHSIRSAGIVFLWMEQLSGHAETKGIPMRVCWQKLGQPCGSATPGRVLLGIKADWDVWYLIRTHTANIFSSLGNLSCRHCLHSYMTIALSHSISFPHSYSEAGHFHNGGAGKIRHDSRSYWLL